MLRTALLLLPLGLLAAEGPGDEAKKELIKLQGTWTVVRVEEGGKSLPAATTKTWSLIVAGGKYHFRPGSDSIEGTYHLEPGHKPKWLDATRTNGTDKGKVLKGIYELNGDELKMCFGAPGDGKRPTDFSTEAGGQRLYVFKRAKP